MNASLVSERTVPAMRETVGSAIVPCGIKSKDVRDGVVVRDVDLDGLCDQVLNLTESLQVVLGLDVFGVGGVHASDQATKRGDTDTFTNTEDGCCRELSYQ